MNGQSKSRVDDQLKGASYPIKCLIVVPSLIRAGAETQTVDLANGLAARGHTVHLCSFESQIDQRGRVSEDVQFHHLRRKSKYDFSMVSRLAAIIDEERIDIVQGVLQIATLIAQLAAWRSTSKPPVVAAVHTTVNRDLKHELFDRILYRRLLRRLPSVVFVCENQRDHWVKKFRELEPLSEVVHNGVDPECFRRDDFAGLARELRATLSIPEEAIVFACIAAFRPEKGHKILIDAFAKLNSNAWLVFAGDGEQRRTMEEYATAAGVKRTTRFLGNIPDTRPLIRASNATVLTSTAVETFSMAMLESMAMAVPMIAPRIGGLNEAIIDGETGLLFPIGDSSALADCMQRIVQSPSKSAELGRSAKRKIVEEFTLEKMAAGSEHILLSALNDIVRDRNQGDGPDA